jgi:uncharacterized protein YkwD
MKRVVLTLLTATILLVASPLAQGEASSDETRITLRDQFLRIINRDRASAKLAPLQLDPQASAIGDTYCREQIRNGTTGHYTIDGLSPYMRYSFGGGNDAVSENAAAWSANYPFNERALLDMIQKSEQAMLQEAAPHDGHRRAILDPYATSVGIGLAWNGGEFRLTQEFIRHYLSWVQPFPRSVLEGEPVIGMARPARGFTVGAISVHYEPLPRTLSATAANEISSYSLPDKRRDYLPRLRSYRERRSNGQLYEVTEQYADGTRGDFLVGTDGAFSFNVPLVDGPGIYTVVVWLDHAGERSPIAASNVSIRVDRASGSGVVAARTR